MYIQIDYRLIDAYLADVTKGNCISRMIKYNMIKRKR